MLRYLILMMCDMISEVAVLYFSTFRERSVQMTLCLGFVEWRRDGTGTHELNHFYLL